MGRPSSVRTETPSWAGRPSHRYRADRYAIVVNRHDKTQLTPSYPPPGICFYQPAGDVVFDLQAETGHNYPHLDAQRARKDNLYLLHSNGEQLDVFQILP